MPSNQPRTPEVEVSADTEDGFIANIYDGEYLIQVQPYENGYQLSLGSKTGRVMQPFSEHMAVQSGFERFSKRTSLCVPK